MVNIQDRVLGAIFGEAIGDALGHPIEAVKGPAVNDLTQDNKFTDDTQMFCAIGEALVDSPPHIDEEEFMQALSENFDEWRRNPLGGSHRAPGGNCMDAVRKLGAGVHWTKTGGLDFKGNGSAMRSGVVGAYYWKNPPYAFRIGALTSVPTHNNLESLLAAGMVAYLVATSISGMTWPEAIANGLRLCEDFATTIPFYPTQVPFGNKFADQSPWYATARFGAAYALGTSWVDIPDAMNQIVDRENLVVDGAAVPAVASGIFFNTRGKRFDDTVLIAVNNSDDTDTIGAISGTIAGARFGFSGINPDWAARIEMGQYLADLAQSIHHASLAYVMTQTAADATLDNIEDIDMDGLFEDGEDAVA